MIELKTPTRYVTAYGAFTREWFIVIDRNEWTTNIRFSLGRLRIVAIL